MVAAADMMITSPYTTPVDATVAQVREVLDRAHVHIVLLVEGGRLLGTVVQDDLVGAADHEPALARSVLEGRTVTPDVPCEDVLRDLSGSGARRLAVVDGEGRLHGLLCLKRNRSGFCSEDDVRAGRAARDPLPG